MSRPAPRRPANPTSREKTSQASPLSRATSRVWSSRGLLLAPELFEALIAPAIPAVEFVARFVLLVIILVVLLGLVEGAGRDDLGVDGARRELCLDLLLGFLRELLLLLAAIENRRAVLIAGVAELLVLHERIDVVPEHVGELGFVPLRGAVDIPPRLCVTGAARRHLLVGGVLNGPSDEAGGGRDDARHLVEVGLDAPETPTRENRSRRLLSLRVCAAHRGGEQTGGKEPSSHERKLPSGALVQLHSTRSVRDVGSIALTIARNRSDPCRPLGRCHRVRRNLELTHAL